MHLSLLTSVFLRPLTAASWRVNPNSVTPYRGCYQSTLSKSLFVIGLIAGAVSAIGQLNAASTVASGVGGIDSTYSGSDGTIQYTWTLPTPGSVGSLGNIHISARLNGTNAEIDAPIGLVPTGAPLILKSTALVSQSGTSSATYVLNFTAGSASTAVTIQMSMAGKILNTDVQANQPLIADVYGNVNPVTTDSAPAKIPYYSGNAMYLADSGVFVNGYFDWQSSNSSEIDPMQAAYKPMSNGARRTVKDRLVLSASQNVADVLPVINNPVSPYLSQVAGRTVLDIWTQSNFNQITQALNTLGAAGVKNCVVVIHDWQQNGYDNALPGVYPSNTSQGGNSPLAAAIAAGRAIGCYVGLHENYSDYYPNFSGFTDSAVALNSDGSQMLGWLNTSTGVQSYATKQTKVLANAATQSPEIHSGLGTDASFIDVKSAALPFFQVDTDSTQTGAGMLSTVVSTNKSLWNYERQTHGGPVFGEGLYHWYWSGLLDGVEAQFGAGSVNSTAELNPLFVDFDLLKIHPLQVNHGMGMYQRWVTAGEDISQTDLMDAYRMQEVIYGHAPYIGGTFWNNVDRVLQEQNLVSPVAQRYGTQAVKSISYQVNGTWTNATAATKANDWSRVSVQYANGDTIIANSQAQPLASGTLQIPQYGWTAQGTNLLAYTALVNGAIADYSQTATSYFANARSQSDLAQSGSIAKPLISAFTQTGVGSATYQVQWQVLDGPQGVSLNDFLQLVDGSGNMVVQLDYNLAVPVTQWKPGQTITNNLQLSIPTTLADGTYSMRIGLYATATGLRVQCQGVDDGSMRYILGNVIVANNGQSVTFQSQAAPVLPPDARMNATGTVVNFNTIRTDGMVSLNLNAGSWTLQSYPRYRNVVIQLNTAQFPLPASISCDSVSVPVPAPVNGYWQLPTNGAQACSWLTR
jgi:hypothetical protein